MQFIEDDDTLDVYLSQFGRTCTLGQGIEFLGILNTPTEIIGSGLATSVEYTLKAKTTDVSTTKRGTTITVDGIKYTVRENSIEDDGSFSTLTLSKN